MDEGPDIASEPMGWAVSVAPPESADLGRLALRRWRRSDADAMDRAILASQAHLRGFMPWAAAHDRANTEGYLGRCEQQWAEHTAFQYALTDSTDGSVVGSAGLMGRIGPGALEIGYWVAVDRIGQGLATLASAWLTEVGFTAREVGRAEIHHDVANIASGRVPAKLGYRLAEEREVPPEAEQETGRHAIWVVTRADWPATAGAALVRAALDESFWPQRPRRRSPHGSRLSPGRTRR